MKTKILLLAVIIFSSGILFGCNKTRNSGENVQPMMIQDLSEPTNSGVVERTVYNKELKDGFRSSIQVQDRMIIKSGEIRIESDNYDELKTAVLKLTSDYKGFVDKTSSTITAAGKKEGGINVRIPADTFDEYVSKLSGFGKIMMQNVTSKDVTDEYIDIEARLNTQKELEKRLLDLLNNKTGKLSDVLDIETKLADVRTQIESAQGRINFLKNQAAYSTLQINIFEPSMLNTSSGGGFFYEIGQSISSGLTGFTEVTGGLVAGLIAFSPVIIFFVILFFIIRKIWRKRKINKVVVQTS